MRRFVVLFGALVLTACSRGTDTPNAPGITLGVTDVVGQWTKVDKSLPPIDLLLTRDGEIVRARLRLSGIEAHGTATFNGRAVTIRFQDGPDPLSGKFLSESELELEFNLPAPQQRLRKQTQ